MSSSQSAGTPTRFDRKKYFPSSWNPGTEEFCALFQNRYGYLNKPLTGGDWFSADERWRLSDSQILKAIACAHQKFFIGLRPGRASRFAVLDIDAGSTYHSLTEVNRIKSLLAQAGINSIVPYRSSSSGGWHLYIFFDQAISSRDLNKQLTLLLQLNDFQVQKGQLEVFPNPGQTNSLGFGLRLPMQPGWGWLHPESMELETDREDITAFEALDLFLFDLENRSNSQHDFHRLKRYVEDKLAAQGHNLPKPERKVRPEKKDNVVSIRRDGVTAAPESTDIVSRAFGQVPPGILADVWLNGRKYFAAGLSGPGQRAEAIFSLSHYLFYGDPERELAALGYGHEEERQSLLEELLSFKHNGQSKDINRGRADALAQITRAANWRPQAKQAEAHRPYSKEVPISWVLENERRKNDARTRIKQAIDQLALSGQRINASKIREKAKCSWKTLYKHADLWNASVEAPVPEPLAAYEQIAADLFENSTHEYNDLLGASLIPSLDPLTSSLSDPLFSKTNEDTSSFVSASAGSFSILGSEDGVMLPLFSAVLVGSIGSTSSAFFPSCSSILKSSSIGSISLLSDLYASDFRSSAPFVFVESLPTKGVVPGHVQFLHWLLGVLKVVLLFGLLCFCTVFRPILNPWSWRYLRGRRYTRKLFADLNLEPP